jgi:hypothetical protein
VAIPLSGRVPGRASGPSRSGVDDGGGSRCVSGKLIGYLGFSHRGVFIGKGAASDVDQGVSPIGGAGQGQAAPPYGEASLWLGSVSSSVFWKLCLISGRSTFFSSNSENISCVTFLKHKNSRKQELAVWHLVNRLVPENA